MPWLDVLLITLLLLVVLDANIRRVLRKREWSAAAEAAGDEQHPTPEFAVSRSVIIVLLYTAVLLGGWFLAGRSWAALGFGWTGGWWALAALLVAVAFWGLTRGTMNGLLHEARTDPDERRFAVRLVRSLRERQFGIPMNRAYVAFGGVWEELVFRGYVFYLLAQWLPPVGVFLACSILFGLSHGSQGIRAVGTTAGIGAVLTALRMMSGSVLLPALVHAGHNANVASLVRQIEALALGEDVEECGSERAEA